MLSLILLAAGIFKLTHVYFTQDQLDMMDLMEFQDMMDLMEFQESQERRVIRDTPLSTARLSVSQSLSPQLPQFTTQPTTVDTLHMLDM